MPIDDNWKLPPTCVYMRPEDFRDMLAFDLIEQGWSESDALAEADCMVEGMPPPSEPDSLLMEVVKRMESGEG